MRIIWALAAKDLRLLLFDRTGFFFVFLWPLIFVIFFGYVTAGMYQSGSNPAQPIPIVVVDEDGTEGSRDYLKSLDESKALKVDALGDRGQAEAMVRKGQRAVCLVVRRGFGAASERIFWGDPMELELIVDPARPMEVGITQGLVQASAFRSIQGLLSDPKRRQRHLQLAREDIRHAANLSVSQRMIMETFINAAAALYEEVDLSGRAGLAGTKRSKATATSQATGGAANWEPVRVYVRQLAEQQSESGSQRTPLSSFSVTFPQGILWGVMACAASFALSLVVERTRGTLPRLTMRQSISGRSSPAKGWLASSVPSVYASAWWLSAGWCSASVLHRTFSWFLPSRVLDSRS